MVARPTCEDIQIMRRARSFFPSPPSPSSTSFHEAAVHESGHAAALLEFLGPGSVKRVWIDASGNGATHHTYKSDRLLVIERLTMLGAAGAAARRGGFLNARCSNGDYRNAVRCARGLSPDQFQPEWRRALDRAERLVARQWCFIQACASALLDRGELDGRAVDQLWTEHGVKPTPSPVEALRMRLAPTPERREIWETNPKRLLGHAVRRDDGLWEAIDASGRSYGIFATSTDAGRALPFQGNRTGEYRTRPMYSQKSKTEARQRSAPRSKNASALNDRTPPARPVDKQQILAALCARDGFDASNPLTFAWWCKDVLPYHRPGA
jgi:hypothetical protein